MQVLNRFTGAIILEDLRDANLRDADLRELASARRRVRV